MKKKSDKLSEKALKKINRKSTEAGEIWSGDAERGKDAPLPESEDTLHSDEQINKNLGEY